MELPAQIKFYRRNNLRKLAKEFGGISLLAKHLNRSPAQLSHLIGATACKFIGDHLANDIEKALGLPSGWLDQPMLDENLSNYEDTWISLSNIPLLLDREVLTWVQNPSRANLQREIQYIKTNLQLNKHAFALKISNDLLEAPSGVSIPRGSIVIADLDRHLKNNDYVVICLEKSLPQISQLVQEGSRRYLSPPNPRYPVTKLTSPNYIICGILRQVIITL
jgi:hypothetical protein